jgi:hypothetical protein
LTARARRRRIVIVRWLLAVSLVLALLACRDPYSFEPGDPNKPDPPAPPQLTMPADGWRSDSYGYPQDVAFSWQPISGPVFYQFEAYGDSVIDPQHLVYANERVASAQLTASFGRYGQYFWRVRAASRNWNDYTDWSTPSRFTLPNPAD